MSFNFGISTNAMFGAGQLLNLHTQLNAPMGAVQGKGAGGHLQRKVHPQQWVSGTSGK